MGGKALSYGLTSRCDKDKFLRVSDEVTNELRKTFDRAEVTKFTNDKSDFGDIDIIVSLSESVNDIKGYIQSVFKPNEIYENSECYSFDYDSVQIDLIFCDLSDFDCFYSYFGYNDLGNYVGKLAHSFGIKYGTTGLYMNHVFRNEKIKIPISRDQRKIYDFFGLDYDKKLSGFNNIEEIFHFVMSSKYFNGEMMKLENLNRINRERDKKRPSYNKFIEFIEKNPKRNQYEPNRDKKSYFKLICDYFPEANIERAIIEFEYKTIKKKLSSYIFNGNIVSEITGLKGKELGNFIAHFQFVMSDYIADSGVFEDFVISNGDDGIRNLISETYIAYAI